MNSVDPLPDDSAPFPPRFWWLRRILLAAVLLLVFLIGLRLWWGWYAWRELQAEIARIVAHGERISPEDFEPKEKIPDEQNAVTLINEAARQIQLGSPDDEKTILRFNQGEIDAGDYEVVEPILERNAGVLALIAEARDRPSLMWDPQFGAQHSVSLLGEYRTLGKLLAAQSRLAAHRGDQTAFIASLCDLVFLSDALAQDPKLIANLIAIANTAMATNHIEELAPGLRMNGDGQSAAATRRQVRELIRQLANTEVVDKAFAQSFEAERMSRLRMLEPIWSGAPDSASVWNRIWAWPTAPLVNLDALKVITDATQFLEASKRQSYRDVLAALSAVQVRSFFPMSSVMIPSNKHSIALHYRGLARRRMAAIALALRLYEFDHGQRPVGLDELVPNYIDAIPHDPFDVVGTPIRYLPNNDPPLLYSVGDDGNDDHGAYALRANGSVDYERLDLPFFLDGQRPGSRQTKPAIGTEELGDDANEENDAGSEAENHESLGESGDE